MSIRAKLNRGPAKGKIVSLDDSRGVDDMVLWAVSPAIRTFIDDPYAISAARPITHEYRRSNRRLANGTVIYEWMGQRG